MDSTITSETKPIENDQQTKLFTEAASCGGDEDETVYYCTHKGDNRETFIPTFRVFFEELNGQRSEFTRVLPSIRSCCFQVAETREAWLWKLVQTINFFLKNELCLQIIEAAIFRNKTQRHFVLRDMLPTIATLRAMEQCR